MSDVFGFSRSNVKRIAKAVQRVERISVRQPSKRERWRSRRHASPLRTFRITSATQDGQNKRWIYEGAMVQKTSSGYGGWTTVIGESGHALYNTLEDQNGSTGTYGNGVTQSHLDSINGIGAPNLETEGTYDLVPIPVGTRVACMRVKVDGESEWWIINVGNGVIGDCPIYEDEGTS